MKKILAITLILSACGSNSSKPATEIPPTTPTVKTPATEISKNTIIGISKKLGSIEIAEKDFPDTMDWHDANVACAKLGKGWRLPTKPELNEMYINNQKIGGFNGDLYWSSWEDGESQYHAKYQNFYNGHQDEADKVNNKFSVRAVRDF